MAKVFVINKPFNNIGGKIYDISPASKYGEIVYVFSDKTVKPSNNTKKALEHARNVLSNITPDDYILWAGGDPLGNTIVSCAVSEYLGGIIKYLKWENINKKGGYYTPVILDLDYVELD